MGLAASMALRMGHSRALAKGVQEALYSKPLFSYNRLPLPICSASKSHCTLSDHKIHHYLLHEADSYQTAH